MAFPPPAGSEVTFTSPIATPVSLSTKSKVSALTGIGAGIVNVNASPSARLPLYALKSKLSLY